MTRRATFTRDELKAAAQVAVENGVAVVIEREGARAIVTPQTTPKGDLFDQVDMTR